MESDTRVRCSGRTGSGVGEEPPWRHWHTVLQQQDDPAVSEPPGAQHPCSGAAGAGGVGVLRPQEQAHPRRSVDVWWSTALVDCAAQRHRLPSIPWSNTRRAIDQTSACHVLCARLIDEGESIFDGCSCRTESSTLIDRWERQLDTKKIAHPLMFLQIWFASLWLRTIPRSSSKRPFSFSVPLEYVDYFPSCAWVSACSTGCEELCLECVSKPQSGFRPPHPHALSHRWGEGKR